MTTRCRFMMFILAISLLQTTIECITKPHSPFCKGSKKYTVRTSYTWNPKGEGTFVPDSELEEPGFTPLLCVAHTKKFYLWREHQLLAVGLEELITNRNFSTIESSLSNYTLNETVYMYNRSAEEDMVTTPDTSDSVMITVDADKRATLISCFAAFQPSPDWFLGFDSREMCVLNQTSQQYEWLRQDDFGIIPMDGGFDSQKFIQNVADRQRPPHGVLQKINYLEQAGTINITSADYVRSPDEQKPYCFPARAQVVRMDGSIARMDQLVLGDVLSTGRETTSPLYMFSHRDEHAIARFRRLHLTSNRSLTASAGHYIYVVNSAVYGSERLVAMDEVRVGDELLSDDGTILRVLRLSWVTDRGLFNPHTRSGELIVDGVRVSAFTRTVKPALARGILSPLRAFHASGFHYWNELLSCALAK